MKVFDICCGLLHKNEAKALATCVKHLPDNPIIIQIGASKGISTCAMLEAKPDIFIFSVDIKPCPWEKESLEQVGLDCKRVVRVLGNSQQMNWPYQVDMIYIDGDHRYNGIKADCEAWLDKVKRGGLIVFHDYVHKGAKPKNQVAQVVDEYFMGIEPFIRVDRVIGFDTKGILFGLGPKDE